ncbi:dephospho-CoA kinase [Kerstersia similis]|uniref:dephospho-CoA kinase n=1 Tax=Kerstersia similis TaxID=206505 RepID=UPI0039EEC79A
MKDAAQVAAGVWLPDDTGGNRLTLGLTGGIGSGKSKVAALLAQWGAGVVDTDVVAHELTAADGAAMPLLRAEFGAQVMRPDGAMDRDWMRAQVFADPGVRQVLEAILHPMIRAETQRQLAQVPGSYRVAVVPLLVESGDWRERVGRVCVVDCDPETQVARVRSRSGLTPETIRRIMNAQATRDERLAVAHDVILNDGMTSEADLLQRVRRVHEQWMSSLQAGR